MQPHRLPRARRLALQPPPACGFEFHSINGQRYWDERAYYAFTLDEIEREIEAPTARNRRHVPELVGPRSKMNGCFAG